MILWLKRIIILPFVALFGVLLVAIPTRLLLASQGLSSHEGEIYARIFALVVAAVAVWLYVRSWKKVELQSAGSAIQKPTTSLITKLLWALAIVIGVPLVYTTIQSSRKDAERKQQPGYAAFAEANLLLTGRSQGVAHGNTPDAKVMASEFSSRLNLARKLGIESRKSTPTVSLTGGEFLTYCLLTRDSCVFMVHVPDLRKFTPEAKDFIAQAAWVTALAVTEPQKATLRNVGVGLRGALLYDRVVSGRPGSTDNWASLRHTVIDDNIECQSYLQGYFALPPPLSNTSPPASPVPK